MIDVIGQKRNQRRRTQAGDRCFQRQLGGDFSQGTGTLPALDAVGERLNLASVIRF